ncbi:MAG: hypothetical protein IBX55_23730 [Methyloprofundus sp.]|nr:hypothetical protein [Methyloprofundus sp.]
MEYLFLLAIILSVIVVLYHQIDMRVNYPSPDNAIGYLKDEPSPKSLRDELLMDTIIRHGINLERLEASPYKSVEGNIIRRNKVKEYLSELCSEVYVRGVDGDNATFILIAKISKDIDDELKQKRLIDLNNDNVSNLAIRLAVKGFANNRIVDGRFKSSWDITQRSLKEL